MFGDPSFVNLLKKLNTRKDSRIILTPHLAELARFFALPQNKNLGFSNITVEQLANSPQIKIDAGKAISKKFPATTIVIKSANTFITTCEYTYIVTDGVQSLAKGGSGDVLAGMIAALLAQGYTSTDATITACQTHASISKSIGEQAWDLSPMRLIKMMS